MSLDYIRSLVLLVFISFKVNSEDNLVFNVAVPIEIPTIRRVVVPLLIRNKAHALPYFLSYFENLDYPKDKISLWIRSDHNEDDSIAILKLWLSRVEKLYHSVDFVYNETERTFNLSTSKVDWSNDRFAHVIALKEEAMHFARGSWADFVFFCDVDVLLTNPQSLRELIDLNLPIVSPMLQSANLVYSNFWAAMNDYYYGRTEEYYKIVHLVNVGEFNVPMVHSAVLVNLNYDPTKFLTFDRNKLIQSQIEHNFKQIDYYVPFDDIIVFAVSAKTFSIPLAVSNSHQYGFISIPTSHSYDTELANFLDLKLILLTKTEDDLLVNKEFQHLITYPEKHKLTFDNIYMINLERRPERRIKMERLLRELGLEYQYFEAVDGKKLSEEMVAEMGIKYLEGYEDPYHARQMKLGEVGCFLSHYNIWRQMIERGEKEVLVLEDDVRFGPNFIENSLMTLKEAREYTKWDFLYFGRKILESQNEYHVHGTENIVSVEYSYWTVGYAITLEGARKLINAEPLKSLIPVDEYIPVMYNRHPNKTWSNAFKNRNLIAYSAYPLLLYPQLYIGDSGYISDTENSVVINPKEDLNNSTDSIELTSSIDHEILGKNMIRDKIEL